MPDSILSEFFSSSFDAHLASDRPHEGEQFASDGGDDDVGMLAARAQTPEALAQSHLGLPCDVLNDLRESFETFANGFGDLGGMTVSPGPLDEDAAGVGVAGLGDGAETAGRAAGVFGRNEADKGGELPWVVEACDVAEFGDGGDGDGVLDASESLKSGDERRQPPGGGVLAQLGLESLEARCDLGDGVKIFLENDLLSGSGADDAREVTQVSVVPVGALRL